MLKCIPNERKHKNNGNPKSGFLTWLVFALTLHLHLFWYVANAIYSSWREVYFIQRKPWKHWTSFRVSIRCRNRIRSFFLSLGSKCWSVPRPVSRNYFQACFAIFLRLSSNFVQWQKFLFPKILIILSRKTSLRLRRKNLKWVILIFQFHATGFCF